MNICPFARDDDTDGMDALNTRENSEEKTGRAAMIDAGSKFLQLYQYDPQHADLRATLDTAIQDMIRIERDPNATDSQKTSQGSVLKQALTMVRLTYYDAETQRLRLPILQIPASFETKSMRNQLRAEAQKYLLQPQPNMPEDRLGLRTSENLRKVKEQLLKATIAETSKSENIQPAANELLTALSDAGWVETRNFDYPLDLRDSPNEAETRRLASANKDANGKPAPIPFMNKREAFFNKFIDENGNLVEGRAYVQTDNNFNFFSVPVATEEKSSE